MPGARGSASGAAGRRQHISRRGHDRRKPDSSAPAGTAVRLRPGLAAASAALLVLVLSFLPVAQASLPALDEAHGRGLAFLAAQGGAGPYPTGLAPYAVEAAHAAGLDPAAWPDPSRAALDSVTVPSPDEPYLGLVRPAYALALAGRLHDWRGEDVAQRLRAGFDGTQSGDPALLNDDLFAGLALLADGADRSDPQVQAVADLLVRHQGEDGGWGYAVGGRSSVDTTAMALLFLDRSGAAAASSLLPSGAVTRANDYILSAQDPATHGFAETPGGSANCDSTAWALRVPLDGRGADGWDYLLALQGPDGGFSYKPGQASNALCTVEAVTVLGDALHGRAAPPPPSRDGLDAPALTPAGMVPLLAILLLAARWFRPI